MVSVKAKQTDWKYYRLRDCLTLVSISYCRNWKVYWILGNLASLGHVELVIGDTGPSHGATPPWSLWFEKDEQSLIELAQAEGATLYSMPETDKLICLVGDTHGYGETGVTLPFEPNHFIQVNQRVNQPNGNSSDWMVRASSRWASARPVLLAWAASSLPIAQQSAFVVGVERCRWNGWQATSNAALNQLSLMQNSTKRILKKSCLVTPDESW